MINIDFLAQIYLISFFVGGIFIVFNLVIGQIGHHSLDHHGLHLPDSHGHSGSGDHQGMSGHHGAADHTASHSQSVHTNAANHSVHSASAHNVSGNNDSANSNSQNWSGNFMSTSIVERLRRRWLILVQGEDIPSRIGMFLIAWLSPMRIAIWLTFFGLSGFFIERFLPWLSLLTLIPAVIIAALTTTLFNSLICWTIDSLQSPSLHSQEDLIGTIAEVNVPMSGNQIGEIVYMIDSGRINCAAKPAKEGVAFKRGAKVMIVEIKDHIAYIEPVTDPALLQDK